MSSTLLDIAVSPYFADRHALDSEFGQPGLYFLQLKRLDDCLDFFHVG